MRNNDYTVLGTYIMSVLIPHNGIKNASIFKIIFIKLGMLVSYNIPFKPLPTLTDNVLGRCRI